MLYSLEPYYPFKKRNLRIQQEAFHLLYNARFSQEPVTEYRKQEFSMIIVS